MEDETLLRKILESNQQKVTRARLTVFRMLRDSEPQAVASLINKSKKQVDRVSIYRILDLYERLGIINRVSMGWKYKVELSDAFLDHHHHASCLGCGKVISIKEDGEIESLIKKFGTKSGFNMTSHILELKGYCRECSEKRQSSDTSQADIKAPTPAKSQT